jgi:hypothetical protein
MSSYFTVLTPTEKNCPKSSLNQFYPVIPSCGQRSKKAFVQQGRNGVGALKPEQARGPAPTKEIFYLFERNLVLIDQKGPKTPGNLSEWVDQNLSK